jgi:hypothetical protein
MEKVKTSDGVAHDATPAPGHELFRASFRDASYYSSGRDWSDYAPAYRYGQASSQHHAGKRFEDVEDVLEAQWSDVRATSRLVWTEARGAVREAWNAARDEANAG